MAVAIPALSANYREERDKIKISIYQLRRDWTGRVPTGRWMQVSCHRHGLAALDAGISRDVS